MDKERLSYAIDTAPRTLVRKDPSVLLHLQVLEDQVRPLDFYGRLSPDTSGLADRLHAVALKGGLTQLQLPPERSSKLP